MTESSLIVEHAVVLVGGVLRRFVVLLRGNVRKVYELAVSERKLTAQLQAAEPLVAAKVLREVDGR